MLNIVVFNGGRGAATIIPALLQQQGVNLTSVVNAYDDGKSTGEIRHFFGMLGPSDIRKVQCLMLPKNDPDYQANLSLFGFRFPADCDRGEVIANLKAFADGSLMELVGIQLGNEKVRNALRRFVGEFIAGLSLSEKTRRKVFKFADCSIMNCIYAGAFLALDRNIEIATRNIDRLFKLKGTVLPTAIQNKKLVALQENGEVLCCEADIVELRSNVRIERIFLIDTQLDLSNIGALTTNEKHCFLANNHSFVTVSEGVKHAIQHANIIVYAAGTQHSSLYPTYLSSGLAATIADNKTGLKVFITNIGADYETPNYKASDYILGAYRYLGISDKRAYNMQELFDVNLVNQSHLKPDETYVVFDETGFTDVPVRLCVENFELTTEPGKHDGQKLVKTILSLYDATKKF
jgi:2-phospho-L-lactate transferase/gluconeogenesis factor (CofD/UPF0052 family)